MSEKPMEEQSEQAGKSSPSRVKRAFRTPQFVLAVILTVLLGGLFWRMLAYPIPPESSGTIYMMMGQYMTVWASFLGWFVWTSFSSDKKTDLLAQAEAIKPHL